MERGKGIPWPAPFFLRRRPLLCVSLCYILGIALSPMLGGMPLLWAIALFFFILGGLLLLKSPYGLLCILVAAGLFGGYRGMAARTPPPLPPMGKWTVTGTIAGSVKVTEKAASFFLQDVAVTLGEEDPTPIRSKVYVYAPDPPRAPLSHGQEVRISGSSYVPNEARNPGGFDQRLWLAQSGAHVRLYATTAPTILSPAPISPVGLGLAVNQALGKRMDALFGPASPVVRAMLLGDDLAVPDSWIDWMRDSGIVHILSVSGLHVALWFLLLERLLRPLPLSPRVRWMVLSAFLLMYTLITGMQGSVLRADIMLLSLQGARVAKRKPDPLTSLGLAALAILLFRPLDLLSPGFQLSFGAVLAIILLGNPLKRALRFLPESISGTLSTSAAAQLGILPISAYWFGRVSLVGLLLNLIAVPLSGLLIPVAALALLLHSLWPPLGFLLAEAAKGISALILLGASLSASLPFAVLRLGALPLPVTAAILLAMLLFSTATVWRLRLRFAALLLLIGGVLAVTFFTMPQGIYYVQLDVGQALCGVLHVKRNAYVYDTGNTGSDLTEYLLYTGSQVAGLFLSHPHADHIGGAIELMESDIPIGRIYVPMDATRYGEEELYTLILAMAKERGIPIQVVQAGDVLSLHGIRADVLAPGPGDMPGKDANSRSIVLNVQLGDTSLLLCGDGDLQDLRVDTDVLQVAHHGGKSAARPDFLSIATPDVALISVGQNNTYGHPHGDTMEALLATGADIYMTQDTGALTLTFQDTLRVEAYIK